MRIRERTCLCVVSFPVRDTRSTTTASQRQIAGVAKIRGRRITFDGGKVGESAAVT